MKQRTKQNNSEQYLTTIGLKQYKIQWKVCVCGGGGEGRGVYSPRATKFWVFVLFLDFLWFGLELFCFLSFVLCHPLLTESTEIVSLKLVSQSLSFFGTQTKMLTLVEWSQAGPVASKFSAVPNYFLPLCLVFPILFS